MKKKNPRAMFHNASVQLFQHAAENRENQTPAEAALWERLKGKALGVRFRRQHPLDRFILDFYCHPALLAIEVDGGYHQDEAIQEIDEGRTAHLKGLGVEVLRLDNVQVLSNMIEVVRIIERTLARRLPLGTQGRAEEEEQDMALLALNDALDYEEPLNYDDDLGKSLARTGKPSAAIRATAQLSAFPNPASDFVTIDYEIYEAFQEAELRFVDVLGRTVYSQTLNTKRDQILINLPKELSGQYECVLTVDGITFSSTALNIAAR